PAASPSLPPPVESMPRLSAKKRRTRAGTALKITLGVTSWRGYSAFSELLPRQERQPFWSDRPASWGREPRRRGRRLRPWGPRRQPQARQERRAVPRQAPQPSWYGRGGAWAWPPQLRERARPPFQQRAQPRRQERQLRP